MNLLISIVYAPIVIYLLNNFDIKKTAIFIALFSFLWLIITFKKAQKEDLKRDLIFPFLYILISCLAFFLNDSFTLKLTPILFSSLISAFIFYSYLIKNSFIFLFLEKFKINIEENEKDYIHKSTLFWFIFSIINIIIHGTVLYTNNEKLWMIYSSFGWYFIFLLAAVLQFLHRKLFFKGI